MEATFNSGAVVDGYCLIRPIGVGGFGRVWLCKNETSGQHHALKEIRGDSAFAERELKAVQTFEQKLGSDSGLMPIKHVGRFNGVLYYVMPLADGDGADSPESPDWKPLTLGQRIEERKRGVSWFSSQEIVKWLVPIIQATNSINAAGLMHRDIKPENILFMGGQPVLSDISLLREDSAMGSVSREFGTPGFRAPSWYTEDGGKPDMYGLAVTLYVALTAEAPDKIGKDKEDYRLPPQGKASLSPQEFAVRERLHDIIRRAMSEKEFGRYGSLDSFADAINQALTVSPPGKLNGCAMALFLFGAVAFLTGLVYGVTRFLESFGSSEEYWENFLAAIILLLLFIGSARRFYRHYKKTRGLAAIRGPIARRICVALIVIGTVWIGGDLLGAGAAVNETLQSILGAAFIYIVAGLLAFRSESRRCQQTCFAFGCIGILIIVLNLFGVRVVEKKSPFVTETRLPDPSRQATLDKIVAERAMALKEFRGWLFPNDQWNLRFERGTWNEFYPEMMQRIEAAMDEKNVQQAAVTAEEKAYLSSKLKPLESEWRTLEECQEIAYQLTRLRSPGAGFFVNAAHRRDATQLEIRRAREQIAATEKRISEVADPALKKLLAAKYAEIQEEVFRTMPELK